MAPATSLYDRLKADLREALRCGDAQTVAALRTLISAIDNAGAVESDAPAWPPTPGPVEIARHELSSSDLHLVVAKEIDEVRSAIAHYREIGAMEDAVRLEARLGVLARYLDQS